MLSLILFVFYINEVRNVIPEGVEVSMYADDIAVWASHQDKKEAERKVQEAARNIEMWSKQNRLQLNPRKCEAGFFTTDSGESNWKLNISIDGTTISHNDHPIFLGVTFDRSLSFNQHVENIVKKAN